MKKILAILLSAILLLQSCVSTKVSANNNFNYSELKTGKSYIVLKKDQNKIRAFALQSIEKDSLSGEINGMKIKIAKNEIEKVKKVSTGKTIALIVGIIGIAIIAPAFYYQKPLGK